jgi:hypothetical protein
LLIFSHCCEIASLRQAFDGDSRLKGIGFRGLFRQIR